MKSPHLRTARVLALLVLLFAVALLASHVFSLARASTARRPSITDHVGSFLTDVQLQTMAGASVMLRERLRGRPALVFVVSKADCASCADLPLELRILHAELSRVATTVVASGASREAFQPYLRRLGLDSIALVDPEQRLLRSFGLTKEPLVFLVDSTGRVLLVDARSTSRAAQYPVSRVLHDIAGVVAPARSSN